MCSAIRRTRFVVTVEEHSITGGLSAVRVAAQVGAYLDRSAG